MRQQRVWMPLPQVADADARETAYQYLSFPDQGKIFSNDANSEKPLSLAWAPEANAPPDSAPRLPA